MNAVDIKDYTKVLKGKAVLSNITLELPESGVYGFYGPNGSGKSMLFRAVAGLIHPTSGEISVFGKKLGKDISMPENIGLVIESVGFWPYNTGYENLATLASIKNKISAQDIKTTLKRVGLNPDDKRIYSRYSLGMKQRLAIAQAIMEKPQLILLDEPTNALDHDGIQNIRTVIKEENERGATILIASHNYDDLKLLCGRFFALHDGLLEETSEEMVK